MYSRKKLVLIGAFVIGSISVSQASCFVGFNADYREMKERTYTKKTCHGGYKKLKKMMKEEAKNICRDRGSPKWDLLKCTSFTKSSCEKIKVRGKKTKVKVKGTFSVYCR